MSHLSRRSFLKESAVLTIGAACGGRRAWSAQSQPRIPLPSAARDRLAVASWPFRAFINSPSNQKARKQDAAGMDLKDFGAMVVQRFGVHNIEPLDRHFASTEPAYLSELRSATEKAGAHIIDIPVGMRESFYDPDPDQRKKAIEASVRWLDVAAALGCPSVRLHIARAGDSKPDAGRAAESLKQVAGHAAAKGIVANLENDDNFTEDPFYIVQVLEMVNSPFLRALPDFCNSMLTHDQEFNDRAMRAMFKLAYNIAHVKDSEVGGKDKLFTVDVAKCFEIAKASGYRGYYSMEWEGAGEPFAGTQKLVDLTLKYLS